MEQLTGQFTFTNKENTVHLNKAPPKTPLTSKSIIFNQNKNLNNNNGSRKLNVLNDAFRTPSNPTEIKVIKRIPLGGKDKNVSHNSLKSNVEEPQRVLLSSSASKRRARRLRTPLGNNKTVRKLNVLRDGDDDIEIESKSGYIYQDEEIEYVPPKEEELPFVPLNYEPFTKEELEAYQRSPPRRLEDCTDDLTDDGRVDPYEEFPVYFDFSDDEAKDKENSKPHFMEPTIASTAKGTKFEAYSDGLTIAELNRLIEE